MHIGIFTKDIKRIINALRRRFHGRRYPFSRVVMYQRIEQQLRAFDAGGLVLGVGATRVYPEKLRWFRGDSHYICINLDTYQRPDVVVDANAMAFKSNAFDVMEVDQLLEHVPNPSQVLSESHRVLKSGGIIVVGVPFMMQIHAAPEDYWRFSESGLKLLLEQARFKDIVTGSWGHEQAVIAHMRYSWHGVRTRRAQRKLLIRESDKRFPLHCWAIARK